MEVNVTLGNAVIGLIAALSADRGKDWVDPAPDFNKALVAAGINAKSFAPAVGYALPTVKVVTAEEDIHVNTLGDVIRLRTAPNVSPDASWPTKADPDPVLDAPTKKK